MPESAPRQSIDGIPASPGRASGPLFVVREDQLPEGLGSLPVTPDQVAGVAERVARGLEDLAAARREQAPEAAAILEAQALMARDPALQASVEEFLAAGRQPSAAFTDAAEGYAKELEGADDPYLAARGADVREVGRLMVAGLAGSQTPRLADLTEPSVVVSQELSPADTLAAEPGRILAFVSESGGVTSHVAIVARELGVPAVVGAAGAVAGALGAGVEGALVDGTAGSVTWLRAGELEGAASGALARARLEGLEQAPVPIMANAGSVATARAAAGLGLRGVGLFRTEFLFLARPSAPGDEEQAEAYGAACAAMAPYPVVVRTLDVGSDKRLPYLPEAAEPNPALGRRGVRLWLANEELRAPQVRALTRTAARHRNLWVMVPMVAAAEEMRRVREVFAAEAEGPTPPLGMMVELPATAVALDAFAGLIDFVSLGTNDLAQYALGSDRELEWPAYLAAFNPGVLRLVSEAVGGARRLGVKVGVCGELAGSPEGAVFLVGLGVDSLSLGASSAEGVLRALGRAGVGGCREAARSALDASDAAGALRVLQGALS